MAIVYCRCGKVMNPEVSILQCPECLNRSLPSIVNPKQTENEAHEFWEKLKKAFGDPKGQ